MIRFSMQVILPESCCPELVYSFVHRNIYHISFGIRIGGTEWSISVRSAVKVHGPQFIQICSCHLIGVHINDLIG